MPGGRAETVDDREILQFFSESDDPVMFTSEVADYFGFSNQGMTPRLKSLARNGLLATKQRGAAVWWLTDKGGRFLAGELNNNGKGG